MKKIIMINVMIILFTGIVRLLPHPWNFTPVLAACIYSGFYMNNLFIALALPLLAVFISDLYIGLYNGMIWVYAAYILIILIGIASKGNTSIKKVGSLALSGSIIFFFVSNLGVWFSGTIYPNTFTGFIACYTAAIPFFHNTLFGTFLYSATFFGLTEWLSKKLDINHILVETR